MTISRFFNFQTKTISSGAWILAVSTILSGGLGFLRDYLLAERFGAGPLDIYFAAFRIPDFVYNILITGGVIVAFLPLFSEYFAKDKEEAWRFTSNLLNVFLFFLILLCLLLFISAPALLKLITPGFNALQQKEAAFLTRMLLLSPLLFGISSVFSGILQYFHRFLVYGLAPVLYNLGIISGILFLAPHFGILGVVFGVVLGAVFYLLVQIPAALNCGFGYKRIFKLREDSIKKFFLLALPRVFGISVQQVNAMFITAIASTLAYGSLAVFTFSYNFGNFMIGIFGTSFAISAFPILSKSLAESKKDEFLENFSSAFHKILYFVIPLSAFIFLFKNEIIAFWLKHGQFSSVDARLVAASLGLLSLGLFASCLIPLIFRGFFAFKDTKTPTFISIFSVFSNIIMGLSFTKILYNENHFSALLRTIFNIQGIKDIRVLGLSLALFISTVLQFILMIIFLRKKEPWKTSSKT